MIQVIACGRRKAEGPLPARSMYVGKPTQRVLAEAEAQGRTFFLSAVHGLVDPDATIVKSYDRHLSELSEPELRVWLLKVRGQLRSRGIDPAELNYVGSAPAYARAVELLRGEQ